MRKIIDKGLELSLIFLMAFLVVDVLWQVLSRYILVSPSSVTDELAGYVLIVGGTWLVYTRFHLGVTSASLEINLGYVYLALPLGGLLTAYYAIDNAITLFRSSNS